MLGFTTVKTADGRSSLCCIASVCCMSTLKHINHNLVNPGICALSISFYMRLPGMMKAALNAVAL